MPAFNFCDDFELGAASSATQVEGVQSDNSWQDWAARGRIKTKDDPARVVDHAARFREDAALMQQMGIRHARIGVEWARIEPKEGAFDDTVLAAYADEIIELKGRGVRPLVTLHHFTNPMWFETSGGFLDARCVERFCRYVEHVVRYFGAMVEEYITINEPNVYAMNGYLTGDWPPGARSLSKTRRVLNHLCACHIAAYETIHRVRDEMKLENTRVSYAHHMSALAPKNPKSAVHRFCTNRARQVFQGGLSRAFLTGEKSFPFRAQKRGLYCDFHAINYYAKSTIGFFCRPKMKDVPVNDLGWEIYPRGIAECADELAALAPLPIYITENGTCDADDSYRARYIAEHLEALMQSGLPVKRYYHWCFTDNFEWLEGMSARFGLVALEGEGRTRRVKQSGAFYSQMIREGGVTNEMDERFCRGEYPTQAKMTVEEKTV